MKNIKKSDSPEKIEASGITDKFKEIGIDIGDGWSKDEYLALANILADNSEKSKEIKEFLIEFIGNCSDENLRHNLDIVQGLVGKGEGVTHGWERFLELHPEIENKLSGNYNLEIQDNSDRQELVKLIGIEKGLIDVNEQNLRILYDNYKKQTLDIDKLNPTIEALFFSYMNSNDPEYEKMGVKNENIGEGVKWEDIKDIILKDVSYNDLKRYGILEEKWVRDADTLSFVVDRSGNVKVYKLVDKGFEEIGSIDDLNKKYLITKKYNLPDDIIISRDNDSSNDSSAEINSEPEHDPVDKKGLSTYVYSGKEDSFSDYESKDLNKVPLSDLKNVVDLDKFLKEQILEPIERENPNMANVMSTLSKKIEPKFLDDYSNLQRISYYILNSNRYSEIMRNKGIEEAVEEFVNDFSKGVVLEPDVSATDLILEGNKISEDIENISIKEKNSYLLRFLRLKYGMEINNMERVVNNLGDRYAIISDESLKSIVDTILSGKASDIKIEEIINDIIDSSLEQNITGKHHVDVNLINPLIEFLTDGMVNIKFLDNSYEKDKLVSEIAKSVWNNINDDEKQELKEIGVRGYKSFAKAITKSPSQYNAREDDSVVRDILNNHNVGYLLDLDSRKLVELSNNGTKYIIDRGSKEVLYSKEIGRGYVSKSVNELISLQRLMDNMPDPHAPKIDSKLLQKIIQDKFSTT